MKCGMVMGLADKVVQLCTDVEFLRPVFPASCEQHISDLHSKSALKLQRVEVWWTSNLRPRPVRIGVGKRRNQPTLDPYAEACL